MFSFTLCSPALAPLVFPLAPPLFSPLVFPVFPLFQMHCMGCPLLPSFMSVIESFVQLFVLPLLMES